MTRQSAESPNPSPVALGILAIMAGMLLLIESWQ